MASPSQALVLRFNTDLGKAQNNIKQFAAQTYLQFEKISTAAKNAGFALDFLAKNSGKIALGAGIAGGVLTAVEAIHLLIGTSRDAGAALEGLNKIATQSASAGVGTTFFQSWTKQAKELNLETSDLVASLEHAREAFTERIGENGAGPTRAAHDRIKQNVLAGHLDTGALSQFTAADTAEAKTRVVLGLVEELQRKGL